jgi:hypothetical protein
MAAFLFTPMSAVHLLRRFQSDVDESKIAVGSSKEHSLDPEIGVSNFWWRGGTSREQMREAAVHTEGGPLAKINNLTARFKFECSGIFLREKRRSVVTCDDAIPAILIIWWLHESET